MSKITFIRCSNKECKYGKSYPVDAGMEKTLKKCPQCDPKAHRTAKNAKQQATMMSNAPKRQSMDVGRVESLDSGFAALKADGVDLEDGADGLGTEVDAPPIKSETGSGGIKIPIIPAQLSPQQRGAKTRKANAAAKK